MLWMRQVLVFISKANTPLELVEDELEKIRAQKTAVVKKQKYEEAAKLRDDEKKVERNLLAAQEDGMKTQN